MELSIYQNPPQKISEKKTQKLLLDPQKSELQLLRHHPLMEKMTPLQFPLILPPPTPQPQLLILELALCANSPGDSIESNKYQEQVLTMYIRKSKSLHVR